MQKSNIAMYILTAVIPLVIILSVFNFLTFYNPDADRKEIVSYLKTGKPIENTELTDDELRHLEDVRALMKFELIAFYILTAIAALLIVLPKDKQLVFSSMYYGGLICIAIALAILILGLFAFDWAFATFHKALFMNDLWLLPSGSTLLKTFPKEFFMDFARKLSLYSTIISAVLITIRKAKRPI